MLTVSLLLIVAFAQLVISLGIFLESRRNKNVAQRIFVVLSLFTFLWTVANTVLLYADEKANELNLGYFNFFNKAGFMLGCLSLLIAYVFTLNYPKVRELRLFHKFIIAAGFTLTLGAATTFISGKFVMQDSASLYEVGEGSFLFALFGLTVGASIYIDAVKALRSTNESLLKKQILTLVAGLTLTIIHALVFIIIIPATLSDSSTVYAIGYLAPYYFMISTIYSLLKHKLFDIRLIVARSVTYLLLVSTLIGIYAAVVFVATTTIFSEDSVFVQQIVPIGTALFLAATASYFKRFFDRITNRFFYRDAYDPQQFLNELNSTIVQNIELGILLRHTTSVIQQNIKSDFCVVEIKEAENSPRRMLGTGEINLSYEDDGLIHQEFVRLNKKTIITDELGSADSNLKAVLSKNDIGLTVRLLPGNELDKEALYYLILGRKKSGNIYNKQDIRIIEIIADELLIAIQNSIRFEEIEQFNVTLQQKVNDATLKLQKTNKKLREMDETKDEFISMASHQLRTPLTAVKGYMSMVLEGDAGKLTKQQESLLNQAFVSSQRMVYLIADLLNVSRLKTGKFVIDATPTDLSEVVEGEIAQLIETAKAKKIELNYNKPKEFSKLMLDETKVRQVIMNFADNAIYYTPNGGKVDIEVKEDKSNIYFTVKDNGLGVPKEDQPHLFTKFFRASNARKARPDGTGLGLFMAKKVVDAQNGTILFESQPGKGSTFGFSFSKKKLESTPVKE